MHNKHILHRDIKCHNIFIAADGCLKLGDFGISREIESTNAKLKTAAGTPYYMAPEVLKGIPYDSKADMWSVGVILYELITLKKPFDCDTVTQVLKMICEVEHTPLPHGTDTNLRLLVNALLTKDHNYRPSVFELVKIPSLRKEIIDFIEEHQLQD